MCRDLENAQTRTTKPGLPSSHCNPMVCTPCALVFTVARIWVPSPRGMAIRSVTSPRIAAWGGVKPRFRPREARPRAETTELFCCKARRTLGSAPTRRDLTGGGEGRDGE